MKTLLDLIKTNAETLTAGLLFDREDGIDQAAINYYLNAFPERQLTELAPFCLIHPLAGERSASEQTRRVALKYCFFQQDRDQALLDLDGLVTAAGPLAAPGRFPPWIKRSFTDAFGEGDNGLQPHPLYLYTITLEYFSSLIQPWR